MFRSNSFKKKLIKKVTRDALIGKKNIIKKDMTGGVSECISITKETNKNELWKYLKTRADDGSYFMGVSAKGDTEGYIGETGLLSGHAYVINK
jgi:hypothetical protein